MYTVDITLKHLKRIYMSNYSAVYGTITFRTKHDLQSALELMASKLYLKGDEGEPRSYHFISEEGRVLRDNESAVSGELTLAYPGITVRNITHGLRELIAKAHSANILVASTDGDYKIVATKKDAGIVSSKEVTRKAVERHYPQELALFDAVMSGSETGDEQIESVIETVELAGDDYGQNYLVSPHELQESVSLSPR